MVSVEKIADTTNATLEGVNQLGHELRTWQNKVMQLIGKLGISELAMVINESPL